MNHSLEYGVIIISSLITLFLLIFVVNWRYFRDWVVVFLFKCVLDLFMGSMIEKSNHLEYPVRLLPNHFDTSIVFEVWVLPVLCILYNQVTQYKKTWPIFYFALIFSAGITAVEYILELYTNLIKFINWHWYFSLCSLTVTFLLSRAFIGFFRWGCSYFPNRYK